MPLKKDKLITPEIIGTVNKPVEIGRFKRIIVEENISAAGFTTAVPDASPQVDHGLTLDPATHKLTFEDNVVGAVTFEGAITMQSTLGVSGTATMAAITASGLITANGGISMGANITLNSYWLSGDGTNEGIQVSAAGVVSTSGKVSVGGNIQLNSKYISNDGDNEGISINDSGVVTCTTLSVINQIQGNSYISVTGYIDAGNAMTATGKIRTNSVFNVSGTDGWTGTFDKATDNTITFVGGIAIGKT